MNNNIRYIGPLLVGREAWEIQILWFVFQLFYTEPADKTRTRGFYFTKRFGVWPDTTWSIKRGLRRTKFRFKKFFRTYIY